MTMIQDAIKESVLTRRTIWLHDYTVLDAAELNKASDSGAQTVPAGTQYWGHDPLGREWTVVLADAEEFAKRYGAPEQTGDDE